MDNYCHLRGRHMKQSASLNHFESFVHQSRGVDGNAFAHLPRGMIERLLDRDGTELRRWSIQEWASGGGQPDALHLLHLATTKALMDGVMLAVDGQQRRTLFPSFGGDQLAAPNKAFLIGSPPGLSRLNRFIGPLKPSHANDSADYEVNVRMGCYLHCTRRSMNHFDFAKASLPEAGAQYIGISFGGDRDHHRSPSSCLFERRLHVSPCGQRDNLESLGIGLDHVQRAATDGPGRSQDGDASHM